MVSKGGPAKGGVRRRAKGSGSIAPIRNGAGEVVAYRAQLDLGWRNGKRIRPVSERVRTKTDAQQKLNELRAAHSRGELRTGKSLTLAKAFDLWMEQRSGLRYNTLRHRGWLFKHPALQVLHVRQIGAIEASEISAVLTEARNHPDRPLSIQSLKHMRTMLSVLFTYARKQPKKFGAIAGNAALDAELPVNEEEETETERLMLTEAQTRTLLRSAHKNQRYGLMFDLMLGLGMRSGELFALKWRNIRWETRQLSVVNNVYWRKAQPGQPSYVFDTPKWGSKRTVTLPRDLLQQLKALQRLQLKERATKKALGLPWTDLDLVFPTGVGTPFSPSNFARDVWTPILEDTKTIPSLKQHDCQQAETRGKTHGQCQHLTRHGLRHNSISRHTEALPLHAVASISGHKSEAIKHYLHTTSRQKDEAAASVERILSLGKRAAGPRAKRRAS